MKYADKRNSPCVVIQGSDEKAKGKVTIKDLIARRRTPKLGKDRERATCRSRPRRNLRSPRTSWLTPSAGARPPRAFSATGARPAACPLPPGAPALTAPTNLHRIATLVVLKGRGISLNAAHGND